MGEHWNTQVVTICFAALFSLLVGCAPASVEKLDAGLKVPNLLSHELPPATIPFTEVTSQVGINFVHDPGVRGAYYLPECMGSGGAWIDFDNDGDLDLYLIQGGQIPGVSEVKPRPNRLYENVEGGHFHDVTDSAGVGDTGYGMGVCAGDIDNDGLDDIYVTNVGPNRLFRNRGNGRFEDITDRAGVGDDRFGTSCAMVDCDQDGWLDLVVLNYVIWNTQRKIPCQGMMSQLDYCSPRVYPPAGDLLYHNNGDGTFTDVTDQAGLGMSIGHGLGIVCDDFNGDGLVDLYVANDQLPNAMWINQGDGTFVDRAIEMTCAINGDGRAEASMGVLAKDFDDDGDTDILLTHLNTETNTLYRNIDNRYFDDVSLAMGFGSSLPNTGWGMGWFDYDHDGWEDLFIANGKITMHQSAPTGTDPYSESNRLYHQDARGHLVDVSSSAGPITQSREVSRGVLIGDYDNDGDQDLLLTNNRGRARLYRNDAPPDGSHWIMLQPLLADGRIAAGAEVVCHQGDRIRRQRVNRCRGYLSSHDPRIHFGLGTDHDLGGAKQIEKVEIGWPDGEIEMWQHLAIDRLHTLRQGTGE